MAGVIYVIANILDSGLGVPAERGIVSQAAVTTSTSTTTTVYAVPTGTANRVYRLSARIFGNSGTVTSGVYEIKWTEGGVAITKDLSISAVDTDTDLSILIQPDQTTNITSQLKTLTGGGTVNIACLVEGVDTGT